MKIIKTNTEALQSIWRGVNTAGNIVRSTLGPAGLNVGIGSKYLKPRNTNDGYTAIKSIELDEEVENYAVRVVEDGAEKTNTEAGDATTTTIILTQEIFNAGYDRFNTGESIIKKLPNPTKLRLEIEKDINFVIDELKKSSKQIKSLKDIEKVAFIAVEDKDLAKLIADVVFKVGKDGKVKVEEGESFNVETYISEGMEINSGFMSPHMATNDKYESIKVNPYILVCNQKISSHHDLSNIANKLAEKDIKDLIVFAPDFNQVAINGFNANIAHNQFNVLAIKVNTWDKGLLEDICTVSGATLVNDLEGVNLNNIEITNLGTVDKVISSIDKTILIGGKEDKESAIDLLKAELKATKGQFDKQKIEDRIARISGKIGIISVGALTEIDRGRLKDKIDDAVNATRGALVEGVVMGGGLELKKLANLLPHSIIHKALIAPYNQIQETTGGIDITEDIIDSTKSIRVALESACNTACNLLNLGTVIVDKNEDDTKQDN